MITLRPWPDCAARRGQIDTARDMRYVDLARLDALDEEVVKRS